MKITNTQKHIIITPGIAGAEISSEALSLLAEYHLARDQEPVTGLYDGHASLMGEGLLTRRFSSLSRPPERVNLPQSAGKDLDIPINDLLVGKIRFALVDLAPGDDRFLFPWIDTNRERLKEAKITLFVLSTITSDHYSHRVFSAVSKRLTEQEKLFVARYYRDPHEDLSAFSQTENPCAARASKFDISARRIETYTYIERYSTVPVLAARVQNTMDVEDLLKRGRVITTHRREMESLGKDLGGALGF